MTAERTVYYEDNEIDNLHYYNDVLKVIYYVVLALYILFGGFFSNNHYTNIFLWLYLILYIALPWILKYIAGYFYEM